MMPGLPGAPIPRCPAGAYGPRDPLPAHATGTGPEPGAQARGPDDAGFLARAVLLGRRGWGRVHPNPLVGCVLVREGVVVGEGWHQEYGGPHAEVHALRAAGEAARAATAYVSLEPCAHQGQTPPCTLALRDAGVARVVFGAADPGPGAGGGEVLRGWGIAVDGPCFDSLTAARENPAFFARAAGRSHLTAKLALSLDARIAASPGVRTAITGQEAAEWVHDLRAGFDGILVGARTARIDNPRLTARGRVIPRFPPARIVVDPSAGLDPRAALVDPSDGARVLVVVGPLAPAERLRALEAAGVEVVQAPAAPGGVDPAAALDALAARGVRSVLCEGGGQVAAAFRGVGRIDRLHLLVAPILLGDGGVPGFPEASGGGDSRPWRPVCAPVPLGRDVLLTYDGEI